MKRLLIVMLVCALALVVGAESASAAGVMFVKNGKVGVLDENPAFPLDVTGTMRTKRIDGSTAAISFTKSGGGGAAQQWIFFNNGTNGNFEIYDATNPATPFTIESGSPAQLLRLTAAGQIKVKGAVVHADYVFEPDYELESIEQHAEYMWENKHLPAVGPGTYDADGTPYFNLGSNLTGVLEEVEKAHIYIERLHDSLKQAEQRNQELAERLAKLEALLAR